ARDGLPDREFALAHPSQPAAIGGGGDVPPAELLIEAAESMHDALGGQIPNPKQAVIAGGRQSLGVGSENGTTHQPIMRQREQFMALRLLPKITPFKTAQ